jgi:O-antigen/teichoic acid export membrane protein
MFLRQSLLYLIANGLAAIIGFLSVVVLTRLVAPAEYGVFIIAMSLGTVLSTCFFTWQRHAILRFQSEREADVRLSLLAGYLATLALHPLALLLLVTVFSIPLHKAAAAVLLAAAGTFYELGQEILRARQHVGAYVRGIVMRSVASLSLCLVAIWFDTGGIGLVVAVIGSYLASSAFNVMRIWSKPRAPARKDDLIMLATYGLPITLSGVFVALTLALDRFVIYTLLGTEAVGLYGATADFIRQCAILPAISASLAIAPLAVANLGDNDGATTERNLADGAELLLAILLPAVIGLSIAAPQLAGTILGPDYRAAAQALIPILAFAFLAHVLSQQYVQLSFALARQPKLYIVHTGSIFLVNALLIVPLVTYWGTYGAAVSLLVSETVGVALGVVMSRFAYPLPLIGARVMRILAASLVMAGACLLAQQWLQRTDIIGLVAIVVTGCATFTLAALSLDVANLRSAGTAALTKRRALVDPVRVAPARVEPVRVDP